MAAGVRSLHNRRTHYTSNYGTLELRRALAEHLERRYGVAYDAVGELLITVGASEAVDLALRRPADPGDEVVLHGRRTSPTPLPSFSPAASSTSRPTSTMTSHSTRRLSRLRSRRGQALFLGCPCNPTGAVLPDDVQEQLADIARRHDLLVYSDEIYDRLAYGTYRHRAFSSLPGMRADDPDGRLLEGLRDDRLAGRLAGGSAAILEGIVKVHQYGIMSAPATAQDAALEALLHGEADVERMVGEYDRRRRLVVDGLNEIGLRTFEPREPSTRSRSASTGLSSEAFA